MGQCNIQEAEHCEQGTCMQDSHTFVSMGTGPDIMSATHTFINVEIGPDVIAMPMVATICTHEFISTQTAVNNSLSTICICSV